MKMTNRLIILAATLLAIASCSREVAELNPPDVSSEGEGREIALSFSGATKANLDWPTPFFEAGDKILLSNDSETETCIVKTRNGKAFIITHLSGPLDAVFPASAAKVEENQITGFEVPSYQDGKFSDAIISMAENITGNHATFDCKVPILKFYADASIGVNRIYVQGTGVASDDNTIGVLVSQYTIRSNPDPRICYIAVRPGINANTLTFTSQTNSQDTVEKQCTTNAVLQAGHTYNAFIPYYIDMGAAGKWGYCNVGAFLPEEYGWYFSWGNVEAYDKVPDYWVSAADGSQFSGGFSEANYNSSSGHTLSTNIPETAQYDAACAYWGEGWRMPTGGPYASAEFVALFNACREEGYTSGELTPEQITTVPTTQGVYFYNVSSGSKGLYFVNAEGTKLFLPYAGYGDDNKRYAGGVYWSSTRFTTGDACALDYTSTKVKPRTYYIGRYGGSIRPVADEVKVEGSLSDYEGGGDLVAIPKGALPGQFTINASGGKVFFSKGNLYWDGDSYEFEANQYDFRHYRGITDECAVINGLRTTTPDGTVGSFHFVKSTETSNKPYDLNYGTPSPADTYGDVLFTNADKTTPNSGFCVFGVTGSYRALSNDEFSYLTQTRPGNRFAYARYKDVPGMLIFPDGYTLPSGYNSNGGAGVAKINDGTGGGDESKFPVDNISDSVWDGMQSAGVVFLPASGYVHGNVSGNYYGAQLNYWLSWTASADKGYCIWSNRDNDLVDIERYHGLTIRLVTDVK